MTQPFDIFAACPPGLEPILQQEVVEAGFAEVAAEAGGVTFRGGWPDVQRANLVLRGATRILARIGSFRAFHLAQLDKRARKFDWAAFLRPDVPIRVEATSRKSKIYHAGAARQRIETAISDTLGAPVSAEAAVTLKLRIDDNLCTFSLDTSGDSLHKRGHKVAVNKAPMRETLAALFLRACGYHGQMPVLDPMCGSGTFVIEAAEIALGLAPGRSRRFAFEDLAGFDPELWQATQQSRHPTSTDHVFRGSDRDQGAVQMATRNADRAQVAAVCRFDTSAISAVARPDGPPGLIMINPPYGARIGKKNMLYGLYAAMGARLLSEFSGWRVGMITTETGLARATGLPFAPAGPPVPHGGLTVRLFQTAALT